ncbi:hypothetical protein [Planctomicrobium piriforme]|uniref:Uncharacterized protein n=1 Tax=Planctomicrobium piriforme TaxID=1576369 RepID=A0A1I3GX65_9PLAN|nr:hypothetical protein [Planctomicrobium piriforme]SFI28023.1 hypothetical protein SAMN05421753_107163 [Planctomicrobium piriforme]
MTLRLNFIVSFCALALLLATPASAQAEARSIQEFMTYQEKWPEFVLSGYVWQLEGRYAVISGNTLTFPQCPLTFLLTSDQVRSRGNTGVVEVKGKLAREDNKLVFRVDSLLSRPKDLERLRTMRFGIDSSNPAEWYKVADWGHQRAKFYDDKELEKEAADLDRNGVLTEFRRLNPADEAGLSRLLATAREKRVDGDLTQQIVHESLQARLTNLRRQNFSDAGYRDLLVLASQELPGSTARLNPWPVELNAKYLANPTSVYAQATPEERAKLHRLFTANVTTERILHDARPDGSNGFDIADRLQADVPEQVELIRKYKDQGLTAQQARVPLMTRSQLLEFCQRLDREGLAALATETKRKWLLAREPLYRQEGARGLTDLADQWMAMLQDQSAATQLYIDAWRVNPQYTPASDWLSTHGYQLVNGTWVPEGQVATMPVSPAEQALRDGRVVAGMTRLQVQSALGGLPTTQTRIVTSQGVSEWWEYREAGVLIHFTRSKRGGESLVESIQSVQRAMPEDVER